VCLLVNWKFLFREETNQYFSGAIQRHAIRIQTSAIRHIIYSDVSNSIMLAIEFLNYNL
jgi:hypothetical protein